MWGALRANLGAAKESLGNQGSGYKVQDPQLKFERCSFRSYFPSFERLVRNDGIEELLH